MKTEDVIQFIVILREMSKKIEKTLYKDKPKQSNHTLRLAHAEIISARQLLGEHLKEKETEGITQV